MRDVDGASEDSVSGCQTKNHQEHKNCGRIIQHVVSGIHDNVLRQEEEECTTHNTLNKYLSFGLRGIVCYGTHALVKKYTAEISLSVMKIDGSAIHFHITR